MMMTEANTNNKVDKNNKKDENNNGDTEEKSGMFGEENIDANANGKRAEKERRHSHIS